MSITPKEKSIELITKFRTMVNDWDCYFDEPRDERKIIADAKKCALIAINEIIDSSTSLPFLGDSGVFGEYIELSANYWKDVKQEIELL
jgi:hypothetical protein